MFPVPSYAEYLSKNNLQHSDKNLEEFTAYANRFMNLETLYYSLKDKLGMKEAQS